MSSPGLDGGGGIIDDEGRFVGGSNTDGVAEQVDIGMVVALEDPRQQDPTTPEDNCSRIENTILASGCAKDNRAKLGLCDIKCTHLKGTCQKNCSKEGIPHSDAIYMALYTCVPAGWELQVQYGWEACINGKRVFGWEPGFSNVCDEELNEEQKPVDRFCTFTKTLTTVSGMVAVGPDGQGAQNIVPCSSCKKYTIKARLIRTVNDRPRVVDTMRIVVDCHQCHQANTPDIGNNEAVLVD